MKTTGLKVNKVNQTSKRIKILVLRKTIHQKKSEKNQNNTVKQVKTKLLR